MWGLQMDCEGMRASSSSGGMVQGGCWLRSSCSCSCRCVSWEKKGQSGGMLATHISPPARAESRTWLLCDAGIGSSISSASEAASTCHTMPTLTLPGWEAFCSRSRTVQRASASLKAAMDTKIRSAGLRAGCGQSCAS